MSLGIVAVLCGICLGLMFHSASSLKKARSWRRKYDSAYDSIEDKKIELEKLYRKKIGEIQNQIAHQNVRVMSQSLAEQSTKQVLTDLQETVVKQYNRMSQEFLGTISDEAEGLSRELHINLCENVWDSIQQFKEATDESPWLIPSGCKIAYTKGKRTVLLIEQSPQVRTINVHDVLVSIHDEAKAASTKGTEIYRFTLAFPYVYFLIAFDDGKYNRHQTFFRNSPLTSVNEHVYFAPLPNIFRDEDGRYGAMCMGRHALKHIADQNTVSRQVDAAIGAFWQTPFSNDLGTGNYDSYFGSWGQWQQKTKEDPLFVLNIKWNNGKTVKGVVQTMLDHRKMNHKNDAMDRKLRKLLDDGVERIVTRLKKDIKAAQQNNTLDKKAIESKVVKDFEKTLSEHTENVFFHCVE